MGNVIYFPIKREQSSYTDSTKCTSTGKRFANYNGNVGPQNAFEEITEQFFHELLLKRQEVLRAKMKIKDMDMKKVREKYPLWTYEDLMDLKAQFQTFDINQDGLIDFEELCSVLEEIGDESTEQTRQDLFSEMDEDGSGGIDFEEYLTIIGKDLGHGISLLRHPNNGGKGSDKKPEPPHPIDPLLALDQERMENASLDSLLHTLTNGASAMMPASQCLGVLKQEGTENAQRVRKLSVAQQIQNGLF